MKDLTLNQIIKKLALELGYPSIKLNALQYMEILKKAHDFKFK